METIKAIDAFCGIGGLTYGLRIAGIDVVAGFDVDVGCKYAYETNNVPTSFIEADVRDINGVDLASRFGNSKKRALVGCAPCQPFSAHTRRSKKTDDCELVREFARLVRECDPELVSMENVPGLAKHSVFQELLNVLTSRGHSIAHGVRDFYFYGVPQRRRRLVLIASKFGEVNLPKRVDKFTTVSEYIRELDSIEHGETHTSDIAHRTLRLSERNLSRIRQSKPGGDWRDWDSSLLNPSQRTAYYPGPYGRMRWDAPAPTITTQFCYYSPGRFGHPEQDRALSVREAALLQTFPPDYKLIDPNREQTIRELARQVGNAVPSHVGTLIGHALQETAQHV